MQKVIISGGNGFVGFTLIRRLLAEGVEVHALVNENHQRLDQILPADCIYELRDNVSSAVEIVTRVQPDAIFHLAAVYAEPASADCVLAMINGNLTLGACLLFAATQCVKRPVFVNTGTYWQFNTNSEYSPNTLYAATKHAFQDLLHFYRSKLGIPSVTLVLYDTFGELDDRPKLWQRLLAADPGTAISLSEGTQTIHLVHIDDVVDAFLHAARLLHKGESLLPLYSIAATSPRPLRDLVEELNSVANLQLALQWGAVPFWEGQVMEPWVGEPLPDWKIKIDVLPALVRQSQQRPGAAVKDELSKVSV